MNNEAMTELEAMADLCAEQKNLDEAIRCLRRVVAIDRTRPGILKKIEGLTRNRDSGKRFILRVIAVVALVAAAGTGWWGFTQYTRNLDADKLKVSNHVAAELDPLAEEFRANSVKFDEALKHLADWNSSTPETVKVDVGQLLGALKRMEDATSTTGKKALALVTEHGSALPPNFVEEHTGRMLKRLVEAREKRDNQLQQIEEGAKSRFEEIWKQLETRPFKVKKDVIWTLSMLQAIKADTVVRLGTRKEDRKDIAEVLKKLEDYEKEFAARQQKADGLWDEGKHRDSHEERCDFLGPYSTVEEFKDLIQFRVLVTTVPATADIQVLAGVEPDDAPARAPRSLKYTVSGGLRFRVSAPGFQPMDVEVSPVKGLFSADSLAKAIPWEKKVVLTKVPTWTSNLGSAGLDSAPVATPDEKFVVAADRNGGLHLVSVEDGTKVQSYDARSVSGFKAAPLVTADSVYAATVEGVLVALDLPSFKERWRKAAADGPGECYGTPVLAGGLLVAAGRGGSVMAFDPATGEAKWTVKLDVGTRLPLLFARDWIVATCEDGRARAFSPDGKGSVITILSSKSEEAGYPPPRSRTLAIGERILMGLEGAGQVFALVELPVPGAASPHVGQKWVAGIPNAEVSGACLAGEDAVLLYSDGTAWRLSPRGGPKQGDLKAKATPEKDAPVGAPAFRGGTLFVATVGGLTAVKPGSTEWVEAWKWTVAGGPPITTSPVVVGKLVLVGARDGRLYAFFQD
jgi:outer membrane protein assembly factor BamB